MKINADSFNDRTIAALSLGLIYFIYFVALSTIGLMLGLHFSAKFSVVTMWVGAALLLGCVPLRLHIKELPGGGQRRKINGLFVLSVLAVMSATGFVSASINRPDIDDSIYAPKAVFYLEHPNQELNNTIVWLGGLPANPMSIVFQYYETIQASLASLFGLRFLDLYHVAFPAIVGFLMGLAMLLVISIFDQRRWVGLFGLILLVLTILSLGETHFSFGNISIARTFHAKYMFLAVGTPAWIYFSLRYFVLRQLSSWLVLLAIGIGMVGATSTALVFLPLLAGLIFASYIISEGRIFQRDSVVLAAGYLSTLIPVVIAALKFRSVAQDTISSGSIINAGRPLTFEGQFDLLTNYQYPVTPSLYIAAWIAILLYSRHWLFFSTWNLLAIIFLLNPLVAGFLIKNITTENIYWRLFYLTPFPIMAAIGFLAVFGDRLISKILGCALLAAACYFAFWGPTSVIRQENRAGLDWPGYKIHEPELSAVKEIAATASSGSMFAPIEISSNMLAYSSKYSQFHMREDYLEFVMQKEGMERSFVDRSRIYKYLYGSAGISEGEQALEEMLSSDSKPDIFVVPESSARQEEVNALLTGHNYRRRPLKTGRYVLYEDLVTR